MSTTMKDEIEQIDHDGIKKLLEETRLIREQLDNLQKDISEIKDMNRARLPGRMKEVSQ